jgi:uroporphyrinogen decarboxylase
MDSVDSGFLRVLAGEVVSPPPVWVMRQAGRYLPEYRAVRAQARDFLHFCYTPALATEVTLQPIRRFGLDASIIFSDILVVPHGLGRKVEFKEGEGPVLEPITPAEVARLGHPDSMRDFLAPVYEAVSTTRAALPPQVPLIGFCGAPWTVATYMIQGRGGDRAPARAWAYRNPEAMQGLLDILVEASVVHLAAKVAAGAAALQIFESWAEGLPPAVFRQMVVAPIARIVAGLRARGVMTPVIAFPRGAGLNLEGFAAETGVDAIGIDTATDLGRARDLAGPRADGRALATQGNIDPQVMVVGGQALRDAVSRTLAATRGVPHVVNLGHGITPDADPAHMAELVRLVRQGAA